jgi:curved DNA-binding protein CbpA
LKNYYELLELPSTATIEEVKKSFRLQIARYHPDKVHHLGKEFQEMAALRAAELTEAYRVLSHEQSRAEYDAALNAGSAAAPQPAHTDAPAPPAAAPAPAAPVAQSDQDPPADAGRPKPKPKQFVQERAHRDTFVRNAILERFRVAFTQIGGAYEEDPARGFDIAYSPKRGLFGRGKGPRLFGRFIDRVDADAIGETWGLVGKMSLSSSEEACVMLMATDVAPARELAGAIADLRRRPLRGAKITVIPVNASIWDAHIPTDAPDIAKNLLNRLRAG